MALLLAVTLTGCGGISRRQDPAEEFRSRVRSEPAGFSARITADYIASREVFSVDCRWDPAKKLTFSLTEPEELAGIRGSVAAPEETVLFENAVLALPPVAEGRILPAAGPYLLMKALAGGQLISSVQEGELLHLTLRESYESSASEAEVWLKEGIPVAAEISRSGKRALSMELSRFSFGPEGV